MIKKGFCRWNISVLYSTVEGLVLTGTISEEIWLVCLLSSMAVSMLDIGGGIDKKGRAIFKTCIKGGVAGG